jgi:hypothetical protein
MLTPENIPIIMGHEPAASNALADGSDAINLKGAKGVLILVSENSAGGDTDLTLTVHEGATAAVAAAGTYAISATFPIWTNLDCAATDLWTRQTDAATYVIDATPAKLNQVAFYIDASILTAGRPWVALGASGGNAGNVVAVTYLLDGARYQGAALPIVTGWGPHRTNPQENKSWGITVLPPSPVSPTSKPD